MSLTFLDWQRSHHQAIGPVPDRVIPYLNQVPFDRLRGHSGRGRGHGGRLRATAPAHHEVRPDRLPSWLRCQEPREDVGGLRKNLGLSSLSDQPAEFPWLDPNQFPRNHRWRAEGLGPRCQARLGPQGDRRPAPYVSSSCRAPAHRGPRPARKPAAARRPGNTTATPACHPSYGTRPTRRRTTRTDTARTIRAPEGAVGHPAATRCASGGSPTSSTLGGRPRRTGPNPNGRPRVATPVPQATSRTRGWVDLPCASAARPEWR